MKKKLYALYALIFFVMVIAYFLSISRTIDLYRTSSRIEKKLLLAQQAPVQSEELEKELERLKENFDFSVDDINIRKELLNKLSTICENAKVNINDFRNISVFSENDAMIETHEVIIEGDFKKLVKVVYDLENLTFGRLASIKFQKEIDRKNKRENLKLYLYVQNIKRT